MNRLIRRAAPPSFALLLALLTSGPALADTILQWAGTGANDSVNFVQLGAPGTAIPSMAPVTTAGGKMALVDFFAGTQGQVALACPATNCNWAPTNLPGGDSLIWTQDQNGNASGPVGFVLGSAAEGVGAEIQNVDALTPFSAEIGVYDTHMNLLNSFTVNSDANGDAFFLGAQDTTGSNIGAVVFSVTDGINDENFAIDTLELKYPPSSVPEPGMFAPLALGIAALGWKRYRCERARA